MLLLGLGTDPLDDVDAIDDANVQQLLQVKPIVDIAIPFDLLKQSVKVPILKGFLAQCADHREVFLELGDVVLEGQRDALRALLALELLDRLDAFPELLVHHVFDLGGVQFRQHAVEPFVLAVFELDRCSPELEVRFVAFDHNVQLRVVGDLHAEQLLALHEGGDPLFRPIEVLPQLVDLVRPLHRRRVVAQRLHPIQVVLVPVHVPVELRLLALQLVHEALLLRVQAPLGVRDIDLDLQWPGERRERPLDHLILDRIAELREHVDLRVDLARSRDQRLRLQLRDVGHELLQPRELLLIVGVGQNALVCFVPLVEDRVGPLVHILANGLQARVSKPVRLVGQHTDDLSAVQLEQRELDHCGCQLLDLHARPHVGVGALADEIDLQRVDVSNLFGEQVRIALVHLLDPLRALKALQHDLTGRLLGLLQKGSCETHVVHQVLRQVAEGHELILQARQG
mmetsp:Transcript_118773/g.343502  ORF Transcript_118773/g.343502 Transcript_118773/m.343502 type:complete len:456 (+) Transcript_118773:66-1433(+)